MDFSTQVNQILSDCEDNGTAQSYGQPEILLNSNGRDIFVISDIHLTAEHNKEAAPDLKISTTDSSLVSFIRYIRKQVIPDSGTLIINGDFIDFLRIINIPETEEDFCEWQDILEKLGIRKKLEFLKSSISRRELRYGLNTNEYKSVWKLNLVIKAHQEVFDVLAEWIYFGNRLIIVKGNHDLEFYWPAIRNLLRLYFAETLCARKNKNAETVLITKVLPNLLFADDSLIIDNRFYIEHGHKFDKHCHCIGGPLLKNKEELNTPFGSYFNRYLLNHIEIAHPPFKHVREKKNILPLLIEKRFFMGIRALLRHIPVLFLIIPMRYYRYLFGRVLLICFTIFLPVLYVIDKFWNIIEPVTMKIDSASQSKPSFSRFFKIPGLNTLENLIFSFISFIVSRSGAYIQLEEPSSLNSFARKKFLDNPHLSIITLGHTHNPEIFRENGRMFYNTGAWMQDSEDETHQSNSFTYLHIEGRSAHNHKAGNFLKWNGKLNCPEPFESKNKSYLKAVGED